MAEFGIKATELSGPSMAGAQPLQPVQMPAQQFNMNWLDLAGGVAKAAMQNSTQPTQLEGAVNWYVQQDTAIKQALDQGTIGASEYESRKRNLWTQTLTNYGGSVGHTNLVLALGKVNTALKGAGYDPEVERSQFLKAAEDKTIAAGIERGAWTAAMANDPDMRPLILADAQRYASNVNQIEMQTKAIELQSKQVSLQNQTYEHQQRVREMQQRDAAQAHFMTNVGGFSDSMYRQLDFARQQIAKGMNPQEVHQEFMLNFNKLGQSVQNGLINDQASMTQFKAVQEAISQNASLLLDPNKLAEAGQSVFNLSKLATTNALMKKDPRIMTMSVLNSQLGQFALGAVGANQLADSMITEMFLADQGKATTAITGNNPQVQTQLFSAIDQTVKGLRAGNSPTAANDQKGVSDTVNGVLREFGKVQDYDKVGLDKAVNFLSGDSVKYALENKMIDPAAMNQARGVYSRLYESGLMKRAFTNFNQIVQRQGTGGQAGDVSTMADLIRLEADDNGKITVVPAFTEADFGKTPGRSALYLRAIEGVNDLNRNMGDFNVALRMGAHLSGRTDYKKFFDEKAPYMFAALMPPTADAIKEARANGYEYISGRAGSEKSWRKINETVGSSASPASASK